MKQAEKIYMISDAAKQVQVEAHVLRYWEEELQIPAKRNEMGHRYYTEEDIGTFRRIKELKEQGLQLKAIRQMLKNGALQSPMLMLEKTQEEAGAQQEASAADMQSLPAQGEVEMGKRHVVMVKKGEFLPVDEKTMSLQEQSKEQKSIRLQQLLKEMILETVKSNNQEICQEIKETLLKELDYQFRLQEEKVDARDEEIARKQEEHYQKIDELLRSYNHRGQKGRKRRTEKDLNKMQKSETENEEKREEEKDSEIVESKNKGFGKGFFRKKRSIV